MRRLALPILLVILLVSACGSSPKQAKSSHRAKKYSDLAVRDDANRRGVSVSEDDEASLEDVIYDSLGHRSGSGVHYGKRSGSGDASFDIPMADNRYVQKWIDYFTGRGRKHYARYLQRSGRFIPYMHTVLRKYGVPRDIVYLSMIESGFNTRAASWASAVGPWQFIKSTGAMYGLNVDYYVDERRDIEKATHAAAQHLKDLHDEFGHWYLAFAAYNAGAGKVRNAIKRHGTNFWDMVEGNYLRQETKDYVPKIIAAAMIGKNPERYGFRSVEYQVPIDYEKVRMASATDLEVAAECAGVDSDLVRLLNSELLQDMTPPHISGYMLKIPAGTKGRFMKRYAALSPAQRMRSIEYVVKRGDTLNGISDRFGVSEAKLAKANPRDVDIRNIKKTRKVKVYTKRGRKAKWQKQSYTVSSYSVSPGAKLTIPRGGGNPSDSMRDDAAALAASERFGINVSKLAQKETPKGKEKKKKDKTRDETEMRVAEREPLPVEPVPAPIALAPKSDDLAVEGDPFAAQDSASAAAEQNDINRGTPLAFNDRPENAAPPDAQLQQAVDSLGFNEESAPAQAAPPPEAPAQVAAKPKAPAPKAKAAKPSLYKVKRGDTLWDIAAANGISIDQLKEWNGRKLDKGLQSGTTIVVQAPKGYTAPEKSRLASNSAKKSKTLKYKVKPGDNLTTIARRHDTTPAELLKLNGMKSPKILPGTMLIVRRGK